MKTEEFDKLRNDIETKIGKDKMAEISDEISSIMVDNTNMNKQISDKDSEISRLRTEKENLVTTNGKLLQKISFDTKTIFNDNDNNDDEGKKKKISLKDCFDDKGNFI